MKQDERHHTLDDFFVGIDLATRQHQVVLLNAQGCRLTSFKVPHSRQGLHELVERCTSPRVRRGRGEFERQPSAVVADCDERQTRRGRREAGLGSHRGRCRSATVGDSQ